MNVWDILILLAVLAAAALAVFHIVRVKRRGGGENVCGGDCARCGRVCARRPEK